MSTRTERSTVPAVTWWGRDSVGVGIAGAFAVIPASTVGLMVAPAAFVVLVIGGLFCYARTVRRRGAGIAAVTAIAACAGMLPLAYGMGLGQQSTPVSFLAGLAAFGSCLGVLRVLAFRLPAFDWGELRWVLLVPLGWALALGAIAVLFGTDPASAGAFASTLEFLGSLAMIALVGPAIVATKLADRFRRMLCAGQARA